MHTRCVDSLPIVYTPICESGTVKLGELVSRLVHTSCPVLPHVCTLLEMTLKVSTYLVCLCWYSETLQSYTSVFSPTGRVSQTYSSKLIASMKVRILGIYVRTASTYICTHYVHTFSTLYVVPVVVNQRFPQDFEYRVSQPVPVALGKFASCNHCSSTKCITR